MNEEFKLNINILLLGLLPSMMTVFLIVLNKIRESGILLPYRSIAVIIVNYGLIFISIATLSVLIFLYAMHNKKVRGGSNG